MSLNEAQKTAVEHLVGPLLIVAGAGAGKTKTITERIGHLLTKGVAPDRILAITFTNKAARELRERVGNEQVFVSTFHALGVHILRDNAQKLGLNRNFTIFDKDDSSREIKSILLELGFDPKSLEPRRVLGGISRAKGDGLNRTSYRANTHSGFFTDTVLSVWQKYEENLQKQKALDFDDLLLKTTELLERDPDTLNHYRERWHYLHIDEYQDTNPIQYRLARLLTGERKNICVVGDVDQSIYSWRGADFRNLLRFEQDFPEAKVVLLEENYRSTQNILAAANEVIKQNRERHDKKLFTRNLAGEKISLTITLDEREEAQLVAEKCAELIRAGKNPNEIAILYRANFQSRVLEEALLRSDIPYQVLGTKFLERQEIKDVLSYLRAALNEEDVVSIRRAINLPPRGLGKVTLAKIFSNQEAELSTKVRAKLAEFRKILQTIREAIPAQKPSDLIRTVIEQTGLAKMWREGGPEEGERLENAKELATLALKYDHFPPQQGIEKLLDDATLASDQDSLDEKDQKKVGVKLMTVHAAKGLEFQTVFIIGLEQDLFPHRGRENENETRDTEEERRLFYVALTRAKEKLSLSYAQLRTIYGSRQVTLPSEFLSDIPSELLETENEPTSFIDF
ncbi:UvrD-helicase domain-containing protein [Candidatus Nomurabacteria bacterium]|nr:UvrD-helicase domain-containing protein [Candidatus Nomurabacteria bacterium]